jgi:hypothetical protein
MIVRHKAVLVAIFGCLAACNDPGTPDAVEAVSKPVVIGGWHMDPFGCNGGATQCNGMHCCPFGQAITSMHRDWNKWECANVSGVTSEAQCTTTSGTITVDGITMHGCPAGKYMKGYHFNNQVATCCPYPASNQPVSRRVDGDNESPFQITDPNLFLAGGQCNSGTLHGCPGSGEVVVGTWMDGSHNLLICEN